jgi:hypothetical protein
MIYSRTAPVLLVAFLGPAAALDQVGQCVPYTGTECAGIVSYDVFLRQGINPYLHIFISFTFLSFTFLPSLFHLPSLSSYPLPSYP